MPIVFPPRVAKLGSMSHCTCIFNAPPHLPRAPPGQGITLSAWERQNLALLCVEVREKLSALPWLVRGSECRGGRWSPGLAPHSSSSSGSQAGPRECGCRTPWTEPTARPCSCASCHPQAARTRSQSFPSPTRQAFLWFCNVVFF